MSQSPEETPPQDAAEPVAVAKKAAKKAAKKTTAKKAAKKTAKKAAKKTTAKKAAVKAVKSAAKLIESSSEPGAPAAASEAPAPVDSTITKPAVALEASIPQEPEKALEPVDSGQAAAPLPQDPQAPAPDSTEASEDERRGNRKFGRVPGGGPIAAPPSNEADDGQSGESRSKKRREKRKRRREKLRQQQPEARQERRNEGRNEKRNDKRNNNEGLEDASDSQNGGRPAQLSGPKTEGDGLLELAPKGFGFLRVPAKNFEQARDDVFVPPDILRRYNLRACQWVHGLYQEGPRGPQLVEVLQVNGQTPDEAAKAPHFDELKAVNPNKRISFETAPERYTTRVVDIMAPIGRGQRGLIVSPPRSGKTTLLLHMAEAIREKYDEQIHLMVLLVDERPEEVTEFRRALPGVEIYASSNDEQPRNHCRIAELAIERARRLVESGQHVFLMMDSITRLARAYNNAMARGGGRNRATGSGGVMIGALEVPRRLFAAARNTREAGSLTIVATALIQTNSRADEAIFMEFKGTGNMELVLDRKIAESYIYPAVDIFKSGTRREELLLPEHMLHKINLIRRGLSGHRPTEAMERLLFFQKKFPNNPQMLLEIKG